MHIYTHIQRKRFGRIHPTLITKVPLGNPREKETSEETSVLCIVSISIENVIEML